MLSHVANYRPICRWRKRKLRQVAKFFPPKRAEFLEQAASVAESAFRSEGNEVRLRASRQFFDELAAPKRWNPGEETPFEKTRILNPRPSERILRTGLRNLVRAFPEFAGAEIVESWGCAIDVTPDAVPVIDTVPTATGLVIASGFSGHGFGIGPGAAHLAARSRRRVVSSNGGKLSSSTRPSESPIRISRRV
jgi:glycine/D-amino acid oxidase-like deaminating enzyme